MVLVPPTLGGELELTRLRLREARLRRALVLASPRARPVLAARLHEVRRRRAELLSPRPR